MRTLSLTCLAAFALLAACSEATAPPDQTTADAETGATLTASVVVNDWFPSAPFVFTGCGEEFTLVGDVDHLVISEHVTPSGKYKWSFHIQTLGATITGEFGNVYRANPGAGNGSLHVDLDGNKYGWTGAATIVAKGVNVDKRLRYKEQVKVLVTPDGTVIADRSVIEVECS
jgi:hypothetical protein